MNPDISMDWTVEKLLQGYPQLAAVFLRWKTDCVGCRLVRFCSVKDVARSYHMDSGKFLEELRLAAEGIEL